MSARILVTEDEGIVAADIEDRLISLGYTVTAVCSNGEDAIAKVDETEPDLIMMDIMIKGDMNGVETASMIKAKHDIPIIFLTAYSDDSTFNRAKITEPFGYILKPFEERELRTNIEMALYKHRMEKEREKLMTELKEALATVKVLKGLLPICAECKQIRDDGSGEWNKFEDFIRENSEAEFTHGVCPSCKERTLQEYMKDRGKGN